MKLRNKQTGETRVFYYLHPTLPNGSVLLGLLDDDGESQTYTYGSLADFNEEWEDYHPKEPLIRDEKKRKAVRAWAEANNAKVVFICALSGGWGVRHDWEDDGEYYSIDLLFKGDAPLGVGNQYTIAELCGEEEE